MGQGRADADRRDEGGYYPLATVLCALIAGIVVDRYIVIAAGLWPISGMAALAVWCYLRCRRWDTVASGFLLISLFSLSGCGHHVAWRLYPSTHVALRTAADSQSVCCQATVLSPPQRRGSPRESPLNPVPQGPLCTFRLRLDQIRDGRRWLPASGVCVLSVADETVPVRPGDKVRLWGNAIAISPPANPGEFDYSLMQRCVRQLRRLHANDRSAIEVLSTPQPTSLRWFLPRIRHVGCAILRRHLPPESAELAIAILLGSRDGMTVGRTHEFLLTGTVHLLAVSGLHVGILAGGIWMLGRCGLLSRRWTLLLVVVFVVLYALLTDAQPPVVRAGVLISVLSAAKFSGRHAAAANALAAAGVLVLSLNPCSLFLLGTQFSFLAVATLVVSAAGRPESVPQDPLDKLIERSRPWYVSSARKIAAYVWQLVGTTAWIWLSAVPLVAYHFHLVTPVALFVNPLVGFPITVALFAGFGVLLLGAWFPLAATAAGVICDYCLRICEWLVHAAAAVPGGHCWIPAPPGWWVAGFYLGLAVWVFGREKCRPGVSWSLGVAWFAVAIICVGGRRQFDEPNTLVSTFVSVGHGTSVVLELPDGQVWVYDAGRLGNPETAVRRISSVLWERGVYRLDGVLLSHADLDHYNALPGLLDRFAVGRIYVTPVMFNRSSESLAALRAAIASYEVPLHQLAAGDGLSLGRGVTFSVLHPPRRGAGGSDNSESLVIGVQYAGQSLVLPGDIEPPGSRHILRQIGRKCDVLMAPHHGSMRSSPTAFVRWANPEWVIISGGDAAACENAVAEYAQRGAVVLHTELAGAVRVRLTRDGVATRSWKRDPW